MIISIMLLNLAYAQNTGTLKVKKPLKEIDSTTIVTLVNLIPDLAKQQDLSDTVQIRWCNNSGDLLTNYCVIGLAVGPALAGGRILSYNATCAHNDVVSLYKSPAKGGNFTRKISKAVGELSRGGNVYFDDIRVLTADQKIIKVSDMVFFKVR